MESLLVTALIILVVAGVVSFLISRAPFIDEPYKSYALYLILAVVVIYLLVVVVVPLLHRLG